VTADELEQPATRAADTSASDGGLYYKLIFGVLPMQFARAPLPAAEEAFKTVAQSSPRCSAQLSLTSAHQTDRRCRDANELR